MMYPLVRELAADGIPVTVSCRVLNLARQPYYRWLQSPLSDRELETAYVTNAVMIDDSQGEGVLVRVDSRDWQCHNLCSCWFVMIPVVGAGKRSFVRCESRCSGFL